jgi:hypothetical protein
MSDIKVFSAMQAGKPMKSYIKTIPAKVYVTVLNPLTGEPDGLILEGDPKKLEESCIIDTWEDKDDVFFKRMNKKHFETGTLILFERPVEIKPSEEELLNAMTDEELTALLGEKFFGFQATVNKMTSQAPLYRLLTLARNLDKSEKIIKFLEGRLAALELEKS